MCCVSGETGSPRMERRGVENGPKDLIVYLKELILGSLSAAFVAQ